MKNIFLVVVLFMLIFVFAVIDKHGTVVYDCRDAQWHPDVPKEVKNECAKMREEQWERLRREDKKKLITT